MIGAPWQAAPDCGDWNDDGAALAPRCVYDARGFKVATFYARPTIAGGRSAATLKARHNDAAAERAALAAAAPDMARLLSDIEQALSCLAYGPRLHELMARAREYAALAP